MSTSILPYFLIALCIRLISLFISISNEKKLKAGGAKEYGVFNSWLLTSFHILYYILCAYEGVEKGKNANEYTLAGAALFLASMFFLYLVIKQLGPVWTVKLIISPTQVVNKSFFFKYIRHPNYFLNVIPEMVAIAFICQAWCVLIYGFPLYLIPLAIRIYQEEKLMRQEFSDY